MRQNLASVFLAPSAWLALTTAAISSFTMDFCKSSSLRRHHSLAKLRKGTQSEHPQSWLREDNFDAVSIISCRSLPRYWLIWLEGSTYTLPYWHFSCRVCSQGLLCVFACFCVSASVSTSIPKAEPYNKSVVLESCDSAGILWVKEPGRQDLFCSHSWHKCL